jgi:hypothetical protein
VDNRIEFITYQKKGMKNRFLFGALAIFILASGFSFINMNSESQLRHVVLFKFKEGTSEMDIKKVEDAFSALPSKIPQIKGYEWGTNNSPEGLDKGFTHCFFLTFDSEEDRAIYLPHPDHKAFGAVLTPHLDDVLVLDYWQK